MVLEIEIYFSAYDIIFLLRQIIALFPCVA